MSRRFLDDVRADIDSNIDTNGINAITGAIVNAVLHDVVDSTVQDEAGIASTSATNNIPTTTNYVALTTCYDVEQGELPGFLDPDFASGEILSGPIAGFTYIAYGNISCEYSANTAIDFVILQNGVPIGTPAKETGEGSNDPIGATLRVLVSSAGSNDVFQVGVRTPGGGDTVDILDINLALVVMPTNNP